MRVWSLIPVLMASAVPEAGAQSAEPDPGWRGRLEGAFGSGENVVRAGAMVPLHLSDQNLIFADARIGIHTDEVVDASLGLGWRTQPAGMTGVFGVYGFADYKETDLGNKYLQGAVGAEAMWRDWSLRANYYYADPKWNVIAEKVIDTELRLEGTTLVERGGLLRASEFAMSGGDLELARYVSLGNSMELAAFAKYFRFDRVDAPLVEGGALRAEFRKRQEQGISWSFGAEYRTDDVRGGATTGLARIHVPFGKLSSGKGAKVPELFMEPLNRNDILTLRQDMGRPIGHDLGPQTFGFAVAPVLNTASGSPLKVITVANGSSGDCTLSDPCSFASAAAAANPGDIIFLSSRNGEINLSNSFTLGAGTHLIGVGDAGFADILTGSGAFRLEESTGRPILYLPDLHYVAVSGSAHVSGITVRGSSTAAPYMLNRALPGIRASGTGLRFHDANFESAGITLTDASDAEIVGIRFTGRDATDDLLRIQDTSGLRLGDTEFVNASLNLRRVDSVMLEDNIFDNGTISAYQLHTYNIRNNVFINSPDFAAILLEGQGHGTISGNLFDGGGNPGRAIRASAVARFNFGILGLVPDMQVRIEDNIFSDWALGAELFTKQISTHVFHPIPISVGLFDNSFNGGGFRGNAGISWACLAASGNTFAGGEMTLTGQDPLGPILPNQPFQLDGFTGGSAADAITYLESQNSVTVQATNTFTAGSCQLPTG